MRGTDITPEQLAAADRFLRRTETCHAPVGVVKREDIVRLMAWYAAVRIEGLSHGAGDDGVVIDTPK